ncbi:DsbA family protein [Sandaracinobacteroides saxicola]|uniref:DsbA family protein n=2 Tax=Sandaracinobacteroides saxicola TaxID=2759707 RepID=A0A7G5IML1_9SPHN|nr:DsbA family protein [Sandaracinobacteroides saxicola]
MMHGRWAWLLGGATVAATTMFAAQTLADPVTPPDKAAIEKIVRDYILAHPEIIPEAINRLQTKEVTKLLATNREAMETPFGSAWAGARDGDVVLVEFFDFNCPYCRQGAADVAKLLAEDPKLKVVFRDFPVLGPDSETASMAALSAAQQGRYTAFYNRMFGTPGRATREKVIATIRAAGLNESRTAADMSAAALKKEVDRNLQLGRALGLTGTPSYIVGNQILSGAVGYDELKKAVAEARKG